MQVIWVDIATRTYYICEAVMQMSLLPPVLWVLLFKRLRKVFLDSGGAWLWVGRAWLSIGYLDLFGESLIVFWGELGCILGGVSL